MTPSTQKIRLTRGKVAVVDAADYELVSRHKWHAVVGWTRKDGTKIWYARTMLPKKDGKKSSIAMHNLILGESPVDHWDGDGLNNRRSNLRACTHSQNLTNKRPFGVSRFKGVSWHKCNKKWRATLQHKGKQQWLGLFDREEDAALAYDVAAQIFHGPFAYLNRV